jgi:hypothetical protein
MTCDHCGKGEATLKAWMYRGEGFDHEDEEVCIDCALHVVDECDGSYVTELIEKRHVRLSFDEIEAKQPTGPWAGMDQSVPFNHPY